jgi:two-component system sensor histidine kinase KdpD
VGRAGALTGVRRLQGLALACVLPLAVSAALFPMRDRLSLVSDALLLLLTVVAAALVGGFGAGLVAGVVATALLNYVFTPPFHTLHVDSPDNAISLVVFAAAAALVSWGLGEVERRRRESLRAATLQAATDVRTALLAAAGHDLRTPLAAAKAAVSSLRSDDVELGQADQDDLLATADAALDRLAALVADLLDLSRLQLGALPVVTRPTVVGEAVVGALDETAVPVAVDVPDDLPDVIADRALLQRVLANLLTNAVRHGPTTVVARAHGAAVDICVVDHGPGVPPQEWESIFVPFQRHGDTTTTDGLGLGLAVSRGVTEAMGGTLTPMATPGGGLTMVVRLESA